MVTAALALLATSLVVPAATPLRLVQTPKPFAVPMFNPPSAKFWSVEPASVLPSAETSDTAPSFVCHIRVIEPDPRIDPKMAMKPPTMDLKIVRRAPCVAPNRTHAPGVAR
jgi:hypothetical protein